MATFNLANQIFIVNPAANVDSTYGPYNSVAEANAAIVSGLRVIGRTVGIITAGAVVEYWWESGITDGDLVVKASSVTLLSTITFNLGSIPTPIKTGSKINSLYLTPYSGLIKGFILTADVSSTTTLDIWKSNNSIPIVSNSIISTSNKPKLIGSQLVSSYDVSGWTTSFSPNDVFLINVETNSNASYLSLQLITEIYP